MKAAAVPKHYSLTCTPDEMRELVIGFRTYVTDYHCPDEAADMLSVLVEAYEGELGSPPGGPIDEDGNELLQG